MILSKRVRDLIHENDLFGAVRVLHKETGCGLAAASETCKEYLATANTMPAQAYGLVFSAEVRGWLIMGRNIQAIKALREETGLSLKDAKTICDWWRENQTLVTKTWEVSTADRGNPYLVIIAPTGERRELPLIPLWDLGNRVPC